MFNADSVDPCSALGLASEVLLQLRQIPFGQLGACESTHLCIHMCNLALKTVLNIFLLFQIAYNVFWQNIMEHLNEMIFRQVRPILEVELNSLA